MRGKMFSALSRAGALMLFLAALAEAQTPTVADTIRFLEQSTFGPNQALISQVQALGFSSFLDQQFAAPVSIYPSLPLQPTTVPVTCTGTCVLDNYTR